MNSFFNTASFSLVGKRPHNEDSIFPDNEHASPLKSLFIVCDGVGGSSKGEVASKMVCTEINDYFVANNIVSSDEEVIQSTIKYVTSQFDQYIDTHHEAHGMASTMTLLHLHKKGATVAHIGDSRVYLFRKGEIVFKTKDHSLVQELYDMGEITAEQMKIHPRRNHITRAIQGLNKRTLKADVSIMHDFQPGDIFFLCTDGVLESCSDDDLQEYFKDNSYIDDVLQIIEDKCNQNSKDNSSAYIVQLNKAYIETLN